MRRPDTPVMAVSVRRALAGVRDRRGRLLVAVAAGWFLVLGMRFVVPAILPTISRDFQGATPPPASP